MSGAEARKLREARGLSQAQLAGLLGVAPNTVARRERGELPISRESEIAIRFACGNYVPGRGIVPAAAAEGGHSRTAAASRDRGRSH